MHRECNPHSLAAGVSERTSIRGKEFPGMQDSSQLAARSFKAKVSSMTASGTRIKIVER
jgi:hypothetical protein